MSRRRRHLAAVLGAASLLLLTACASPVGDAPPGLSLGSLWPAPPEGEVVAQGTVMDAGGDIELCLGAVMESYPPQCRGIPLDGWSWSDVDGAESSGDVTWVAYAVQGTYDGERFTVTQPPALLALYDPMPLPDPTGGEPGEGEPGRLAEIQEELPDRLGDALLGTYPDNGYLWVDVVWDDGTWQRAADADYGENVVVIRSALRVLESAS